MSSTEGTYKKLKPPRTETWNRRYQEAFGLPEGRPASISCNNIEHLFSHVRTLDEGSTGFNRIGGCNLGVHVVKRRADGRLLVQKRIDPRTPWLEREIHILHVLKHPNIAAFVDASITKDPKTTTLYLEYYELGSLDRVINRYLGYNIKAPPVQIPETFVWHAFSNITSALQYLHHGLYPNDAVPCRSESTPDYKLARDMQSTWPTILHRDIKTQNIFLRYVKPIQKTQRRARGFPLCFLDKDYNYDLPVFPTLVLGDFGLASQQEDKDFGETENIWGTCNWLPPELPETTARGDIWALGLLLYSICKLLPSGPLPGPPNEIRDLEEMKDWCKQEKTRNAVHKLTLGKAYSDDLDMIVRLCLKRKKEDRPFAFRLLEYIKEGQNRAEIVGFLREKEFPKWVFGGK